MTNEEIMQALRCRARHEKATNEGCKKCPYWATENLKEWQKLCGWASCEVYQIISDAADAIERLTAENAELRKEIEWKDMVISLAQREQAKALDAADLIDRLTAENVALREKQRWIPVVERLPEPETDVLAVCNRNGYIFVIPAIYEDGKKLTRDSAWNWIDIYCYGLYDEEADDFYIPEGWWENRKFNPDDVYNNPVDCAVTHWMPMLEAPKEGGEADA